MVVRGIGAESLVRMMSEDKRRCPDLAWLLADPQGPDEESAFTRDRGRLD